MFNEGNFCINFGQLSLPFSFGHCFYFEQAGKETTLWLLGCLKVNKSESLGGTVICSIFSTPCPEF